MKLSFLVFVCCLWAMVHSGRLSVRSILDNEVDSGSMEYDAPVDSWVRITKSPPKQVSVNFGEMVELECEAHGGYPAPVIEWYKDSVKISDNERFSNIMSNFPLKGLANARARLRIIADKTDIYYCRAQSGTKVSKASTKINVIGKRLSEFISNEITEFKEHPNKEEIDSARIVFFDTIYMNNIGSTAEIPCKSAGNPAPDSIWLGPNSQYIEPGSDPRYTVLPTGGLRISNLKWNDMGPYTCVAKNDFGQDSIQTFVYPMLADK